MHSFSKFITLSVIWLTVTSSLPCLAEGLPGGQANSAGPDPVRGRALRDARELMRGGDALAAINLLERRFAVHPEESELKALLGMALLQSVIESDDRLFNRLDHYVSLTSMDAAALQEEGQVFRDIRTALILIKTKSEESLAADLQAFSASSKRIGRAISLTSTGEQGSAWDERLAYAWLSVYSHLRQERLTLAHGTLGKLRDRKVTAFALPPDVQAAAKSDAGQGARAAITASLGRLAKTHPGDSHPYLAAAECLSLIRPRSVDPRVQYIRSGELLRPLDVRPLIAAQVHPAADGQRAPEHRLIEAAGFDQVSDLLVAVTSLERGDLRRAADYQLLLSSLADGEETPRQALNRLKNDAGMAGVLALERVRTALSVGGQFHESIPDLLEARDRGVKSRPSFVTIPAVIRSRFLGSEVIGPALWMNGFSYSGISALLSVAARNQPDEKQRVSLLLLRAGLGRQLIASDLSHDALLGRRMLVESAASLLRLPDISQDLRELLTEETEKLRIDGARLEGQHLVRLVFFGGQLHPITRAGSSQSYVAPFIIGQPNGATITGR